MVHSSFSHASSRLHLCSFIIYRYRRSLSIFSKVFVLYAVLYCQAVKLPWIFHFNCHYFSCFPINQYTILTAIYQYWIRHSNDIHCYILHTLFIYFCKFCWQCHRTDIYPVIVRGSFKPLSFLHEISETNWNIIHT